MLYPTELTVEDVQAGIARFQQRRGWARDLHARFYAELRDALHAGLTEEWWAKTVPRLAVWRALRPHSKAEIFEEGRRALPALKSAYQLILGIAGDAGQDLGCAAWPVLQPLFTAAHSIKDSVHRRQLGRGLPSAVFASKLCHFISPSAYLVVDNAMMGGCSDYAEFWLGCQRLWRDSAVRHDTLTEVLRRYVGSSDADGYPWATRTVELAIMGSRCRGG